MSGHTEVDEAYFGGRAEFMHEAKKRRLPLGGPNGAKATVFGLLERTNDQRVSRVRATVIKDANKRTIHGAIHASVEPGSRLSTDSMGSYKGLDRHFIHEAVNHRAQEYVRGTVHTNGIENFWSLLKRSVKGTYVSVEPFHLQRYVEEQVFRFNERKDDDGGRFKKVLGSVTGKRLTYKDLINHASFVW